MGPSWRLTRRENRSQPGRRGAGRGKGGYSDCGPDSVSLSRERFQWVERPAGPRGCKTFQPRLVKVDFI